MRQLFCALALWLIIAPDCCVSDDYAEAREIDKAKVLQNFFKHEGIEFNASDTNLIEKYNDETIELIADMCQHDHEVKYDPNMLVLNGHINEKIYQSQVLSRPELTDYEAMVASFDLIVPDSMSDDLYRNIKSEFGAFHRNNKELAEELLSQTLEQLKQGDWHTYEIIGFLKNAYYQWIPLAHLNAFIERHAVSGQ